MYKSKPELIYAFIFPNDTILNHYNNNCKHLNTMANVLKNEDYLFNGLTKIVIDNLFKNIIACNGSVNQAYSLIKDNIQCCSYNVVNDLSFCDETDTSLYLDMDLFQLIELLTNEITNYYKYIFDLFEFTSAIEKMLEDRKIKKCIIHGKSLYSKVSINHNKITVIEALDYNRY